MRTDRFLTGLGFAVGLLIAGVCIHIGARTTGDVPVRYSTGIYTGP